MKHDKPNPTIPVKPTDPMAGDIISGKDEIAGFLNTISSGGWDDRKVKYAREKGALPIRVKSGLGMYASKSELWAAFFSPDTLPQGT